MSHWRTRFFQSCWKQLKAAFFMIFISVVHTSRLALYTRQQIFTIMSHWITRFFKRCQAHLKFTPSPFPRKPRDTSHLCKNALPRPCDSVLSRNRTWKKEITRKQDLVTFYVRKSCLCYENKIEKKKVTMSCVAKSWTLSNEKTWRMSYAMNS